MHAPLGTASLFLLGVSLIVHVLKRGASQSGHSCVNGSLEFPLLAEIVLHQPLDKIVQIFFCTLRRYYLPSTRTIWKGRKAQGLLPGTCAQLSKPGVEHEMPWPSPAATVLSLDALTAQGGSSPAPACLELSLVPAFPHPTLPTCLEKLSFGIRQEKHCFAFVYFVCLALKDFGT